MVQQQSYVTTKATTWVKIPMSIPNVDPPVVALYVKENHSCHYGSVKVG